jgi:hypothetical protein
VIEKSRGRLRGARRAASMPAPATGSVIVQRRISQCGSIMVATQRIHVGMIHACKIVSTCRRSLSAWMP